MSAADIIKAAIEGTYEGDFADFAIELSEFGEVRDIRLNAGVPSDTHHAAEQATRTTILLTVDEVERMLGR